MTKDQILEAVGQMTVLELSELITMMEEKFNVSAAAAVAAAPAATAAVAVEEKTEFALELTETGASKVSVIKVVRAATGLGLKEAKDMVDAAPKVIKEGMSKADAEAMQKDFEAAGAKVTLK